MWILSYSDYDDGYNTALSVSLNKEKLESRRQDLIKIYHEFHNDYKAKQSVYYQNLNLFITHTIVPYLNEHFNELWNPNHELGLWVEEKTIYPPGYIGLSGASPLFREEQPTHHIREIGELERTNILNTLIDWMVRQSNTCHLLKLVGRKVHDELMQDCPKYPEYKEPADYYSFPNGLQIQEVEEL